MNTTYRRMAAGIALLVTTALTATGCIGVDRGDLPAAGEPTSFILHPRFANSGPDAGAGPTNRWRWLTDPGDVNGNYAPSPDKGRPTLMTVSWPTSQGRGSLAFTNFTRGSNGSYFVEVTFPAGMCRPTSAGASPVIIHVTWSSGVTEGAFLPVARGGRC